MKADVMLAGSEELPAIAVRVHEEFARGQSGYVDVLGSLFEVGRLLSRARAIFPADPDFGRWFNAQEFPFALDWARTLREAARREELVRADLERQINRTGQFNLRRALRQAKNEGDPQAQALPLPRSEPHYAREGGRDDVALRADYARPESVEAMLEWFQDLHVRLIAQVRLQDNATEYVQGFTAGQIAVTELAVGFLSYLVG